MGSREDSYSPESIVRQAVERWRSGEKPNAQEVIARHPELKHRKSLAVDLIYEEYCLRQEQGETFVASTFLNRFPAYRQSLARMLEVHEFLDENPDIRQPAWPKPGEIFQGFEIVELIGAGAVARVFLAREIDVGHRHVVVKISQFGRGEARLLGKIEHPGVVPIHSVHDDPDSGMTCICMPFLGTATLVDLLDAAFVHGRPPERGDVIARAALDYLPIGLDASAWPPIDPFFRDATYVEGVVYLVRQIAAALAKAHQAGIMHRDIKPSNVLLARDGRAMLLDFNLSTDVREAMERVGGTLAYMAPEQIEALLSGRAETSTRIDPRSDLYSLGALLYELLTGELPSKPEVAGRAPGLEAWLECRLTLPPSARAKNRQVEPELDEIVRRCLSPSPVDRYASADELSEALAKLLAPRQRLARKVRRHRRAILAAGIGLTAAAAAGGVYWLSLPPYPQRRFEAGVQLLAAGNAAEARETFKDALELGYDECLCRFARGQANRKLGQYQLAFEEFMYCLQDGQRGRPAGERSLVKVYLGQAALEASNYVGAQQFLREARDEGWNVVPVVQNLGIAYGAAGLLNLACDEFDKILHKIPQDVETLFNRGMAWEYWCTTKNAPPPKEILAEIDRLRKANTGDNELCFLAASLYVRAALHDATLKGAAESLLDASTTAQVEPSAIMRLRNQLNGQPYMEKGARTPTLRWRRASMPESANLAQCDIELRRSLPVG